jgi:nickel-dependent lactate racemase
MAGVDFIINLTLDSNWQITGIFSGELEKAHLVAVEHIRSFAKIKLNKLYDVVITQAGPVGINHYQCAKAVFEAARAVKPGGWIILVANLADSEPVGSQNYKDMLRLAAKLGPKDFIETILADGWQFVPDQWQVQMWSKALQKLGSPKHLYTCATQLQYYPDELFPEVNVASQVKRLSGESDIDFTQRITQQTIDQIIKNVPDEEILVLPDGPYAIPVFE